MSYEDQYREQIQTILNKGKWINNKRTGTRCLTISRYIQEYSLDEKSTPLLQARPSYPVSAVAEVIGYLRQYQWADEFERIGSPTWFVNANETKDWISNPHRLGKDHMGKVYGASVRKQDLENVLKNISDNNDDRGLLINWWQPHTFEYGCLRPCMNQHNFSIINGVVDLTSTQRSTDMMCGKNFNALQVYFLGMLAAKLSGNEGGTALHVMNHCHIYEDHLDGVEEYLSRKPASLDTTFKIKGWVQDYQDITQNDDHAKEYFTLEGYKGNIQPKIDFKLIA